jgi:Peroxiredoxin
MSNGEELKVGDEAPVFEATAVGAEYGEGRKVSLRDFRGIPVVLYFYPKDDTPGCTAQACSLRDSWGSAE